MHFLNLSLYMESITCEIVVRKSRYYVNLSPDKLSANVGD